MPAKSSRYETSADKSSAFFSRSNLENVATASDQIIIMKRRVSKRTSSGRHGAKRSTASKADQTEDDDILPLIMPHGHLPSPNALSNKQFLEGLDRRPLRQESRGGPVNSFFVSYRHGPRARA